MGDPQNRGEEGQESLPPPRRPPGPKKEGEGVNKDGCSDEFYGKRLMWGVVMAIIMHNGEDDYLVNLNVSLDPQNY